MTALIIDGKINPEFVGRDIDRYYVCNGLVEKRESESNGVTHGTIVTQVVSQYGCFDEIYAIEILNDDEKGNVHDLIAALMWCKNKKIDIINISMGSTNDYCSRKVNRICRSLVKEGKIIVSAENNYGLVSFPSKFQDVISVKHVRFLKLALFDKKRNRIYVSGEHWLKFSNGAYTKTQQSNSYACAYATALLSRKVGQLHSDRDKKRFQIIWKKRQ